MLADSTCGSGKVKVVATERRSKHRLHSWRVLLVCCLVGVVYLVTLAVRIAVAGQQDDLTHRASGRPVADVIIVLGASQANGRPSQILRKRLDHAIMLYQRGYAPYLLFTGGMQPGDQYTEAETGHRYAVRHGVPESAILLEPEGRTTMQSLQSSSGIMRQYHLQRAILVSDPFHVFRLRRIASDIRLTALVSPAADSAVHGSLQQMRYIMREVGAYSAYRFCGL